MQKIKFYLWLFAFFARKIHLPHARIEQVNDRVDRVVGFVLINILDESSNDVACVSDSKINGSGVDDDDGDGNDEGDVDGGDDNDGDDVGAIDDDDDGGDDDDEQWPNLTSSF